MILLQLKQLADDQSIRPIDYQFARFIYDLHNNDLLALVSALVSHQLGQGHVCLALDTIDNQQLFGQNALISEQLISQSGSPVDQWATILPTLPTIGNGTLPTPLVLDNQRLYLYRYWEYEHNVAYFLQAKSAIDVDKEAANLILGRLFRRNYRFLWQQCQTQNTPSDIQTTLTKWLDIETPQSLDWHAITQCINAAKQADDLNALDKLIPQNTCLNWQKVAAALAATQSFSVISGGPGTGKTTTVVRLLALLIELGISKVPYR